MDDSDEQGRPDPLVADGAASYDDEANVWVLTIAPGSVGNVSDFARDEHWSRTTDWRRIVEDPYAELEQYHYSLDRGGKLTRCH